MACVIDASILKSLFTLFSTSSRSNFYKSVLHHKVNRNVVTDWQEERDPDVNQQLVATGTWSGTGGRSEFE